MKNLCKTLFLCVSFASLLSACTFTITTSNSSASSSLLLTSVSDSISSSQASSETSGISSTSNATSLTPWKLKWADEFTGTSLNTNNWEPMIGNGSNYGVYEWGNGEAEYYKSENATVADGTLTIACKKEDNSADGKTYNYSSARLRTAGKVSTTYGRVEARISLPNVVGMWPAFWMLPETNYLGQGWPYSGEIDIMENKGRQARTTSGALHYSISTGHTYKTNTASLTSLITDYHVYAIEWTKDDIRWFVDDTQFLIVRKTVWHPADSAVYTTNDDAPFNQPFHVLLNLAVGGQFDSYALPPDSLVPCEMKVDYVRIYEANV